MKLPRLKKRKRVGIGNWPIPRILYYTFYTFALAVSAFGSHWGLDFEGLRLFSPILWAQAQEIELTLPVLTTAEAGGSEVVGYDMQIDDGHNGEFRFVLGGDRSANTLATSVLLTAAGDGIEAGLTYRVRYRAINVIGEGPWSDIAHIRAALLPSAPASPVVTYFDATRIDLALSPTQNDGGTAGGAAFQYHLHVNEGAEGTTFHKITGYDGAALAYSLAAGDAIGSGGLVFTAGLIYTFKLTAENEVGDSELRYPAPTTRVAMGGTPAQPSNLVVDMDHSSEALHMLSWSEPAFTDALPTLRYLIYTDSGIPGSSTVVYNSTAMNVLQFNHTGLTPGALYAYWFQIENFNGLSPDLVSESASQVARHACAIPAAFASLEVTGKSSTAITIQWREPGISTGCPIKGYSVLADDGAAGALGAVTLPGSEALLPATIYTLEVSGPGVHTLVVGSEHRFAVVAVSDVGQV